jgi:hypothetical protein
MAATSALGSSGAGRACRRAPSRPGGQGHPLGLPEPVGDADRHIVLTGLEEHSRHASQIIGQDE